MKKLIQCALAFIFPVAAFAQTIVEIPAGNAQGTGASATIARKPYGNYWGYERAEYLFSAVEMNGAGTIGKIGFYVDALSTPAATLPVKIYVKETSAISLVSAAFSDEITGATLVFDGTLTSADFNVGAWTEVNLTSPFIYGGTNNLVVLIESNGGGAGTEGSTAKTFRYTDAVDVMQYWQADNTPPTSTGTVVAYRSNIRFTMAPTTPCNEPPVGGAAIASVMSACPNTSVSVSLSGSETGTGISYQWQSSSDGLAWSNIASANSYGISQTLTAPTYYRCNITCGATTVASDSVFIDLNAVIDCYCSSTATSVNDDDIGNVTFANINNGSATPALNNTTSVNTYTDYSSITGNVFSGATYPISISQINSGSFYSSLVNVYIDYNIDGTFDVNTELAFSGTTTTAGTAVTGSVTIPANATVGLTKMRVVLDESDVADACGTYTWGETEDYSINIALPTACTEPPVVGTLVASNDTVCGGEVVSFSLNGSDFGLGLSYLWETSDNNVNWVADTSTSSMTSIAIDQGKYVRCTITCGSSSTTSNVVFVFVKPNAQCVCTTGLHTNTCGTDIVSSITITGTAFSTTDNACNLTGEPYVFNNPVGSLTTTLIKGVSYPFNITTQSDNIISVWIDADSSGSLSAAEHTQIALTTTAGANTTTNITVPLGAVSGQVLMRVRTRATGFDNGPNDACLTFVSGETQDFMVTLVDPTPCSGTPEAGTAVVANSNICDTTIITINLSGNDIASGLHYQWQKSSNGTVWVNLTNDTLSSLTVDPSGDTHYRCVVSCAALSDTSSEVSIVETPCYCQSEATTTADDDIGNVTFADINNGDPNPATNNSTAINTYSDFTSIIASISAGTDYPISITQINSAGFYETNVNVYIDYNQDGTFDETTELVASGATTTANNVVEDTVQVPITALNGLTRMRVVMSEATVTACGNYTWGETEDYSVMIGDANPCAAPASAGTAVSNYPSVCSGEVVKVSILGASTGYDLMIQWQSSPDGSAWSDIVGATNKNYNVTVVTGEFFRCIVSCGVSSDTSNVIYVGLKAANLCYCQSFATDTSDDDIGNVTFNTINNGNPIPAVNNPLSYESYNDYTYISTTVYKTMTYPLSVTQINSGVHFPSNIHVYIDYDQNGSFNDAGELVMSGTTTNNFGGNVVDSNITIPATALNGTTGMRVVLVETDVPTSCGSYGYGETEDYTINIYSLAACTAPPLAGTATVSKNYVCEGNSETLYLNLENYQPGSGQTYQWQVSGDNVSFTNIANATQPSVTYLSDGTSAYFRCKVTCGGFDAFSTVAYVFAKPISQCYCDNVQLNACDTTKGISLIELVSTTFSCIEECTSGGNAYLSFDENGSYASSMYQGAYHLLNVRTQGSYTIGAWVDFNRNGIFENSEYTLVAAASVNAANNMKNIAVPMGASLGKTGFRVRAIPTALNMTADNACTYYDGGETKDFITEIMLYTGVKKAEGGAIFRVYPNPAKTELNVVAELNSEGSIKLSMANGQVVFQEKTINTTVINKKINTASLAPGIYMLEVTGSNQRYIEKVVIE